MWLDKTGVFEGQNIAVELERDEVVVKVLIDFDFTFPSTRLVEPRVHTAFRFFSEDFSTDEVFLHAVAPTHLVAMEEY